MPLDRRLYVAALQLGLVDPSPFRSHVTISEELGVCLRMLKEVMAWNGKQAGLAANAAFVAVRDEARRHNRQRRRIRDRLQAELRVVVATIPAEEPEQAMAAEVACSLQASLSQLGKRRKVPGKALPGKQFKRQEIKRLMARSLRLAAELEAACEQERLNNAGALLQQYLLSRWRSSLDSSGAAA